MKTHPSHFSGKRKPFRSQYQLGVTLIELLVGLSIGLLVIAVAMGALMVSRGVSGTVRDASDIQQQSAYLMRVIGLQLRQAGSLYLNPNPSGGSTGFPAMVPVAFETAAPAISGGNNYDPIMHNLGAPSGGLSTGFRRYKESVYTAATDQTIGRNCLGGPTDANSDQRVESVFQLSGSELQCQGNGGIAQPIAQNVANFQVRYLVQNNTNPTNLTVQYVTGTAVTDWLTVQAVEVCFVLYGAEAINMPTGGASTYRDCNGTAIDMTTLAGARNQRMHVTYRNVFQVRSQGLTKAQLLPL